jgi:hypothetical protein
MQLRAPRLNLSMKAAGGTLHILYHILNFEMVGDRKIAESACACINVMCGEEASGDLLRVHISSILTADFYNSLTQPPSSLLDFFLNDHFSTKDGRSWSALTRSELRQLLFEMIADLDDESIAGWNSTVDRCSIGDIHNLWARQEGEGVEIRDAQGGEPSKRPALPPRLSISSHHTTSSSPTNNKSNYSASQESRFDLGKSELSVFLYK